jgi:uncharacterized repeat protein (TIGR01451 family)
MATIGSGISKVGFANTKLFSAVTFAKSAVPPSGAAVVAGDSITYTVTYSNSGNVATDVSITDEVPSGTTYVTGSAADGVLAGSTLTWNRSAAADGTGSVSFTVTVNSGLADPTTIHNVALGWVGESSTPTNPTDHPVAHVTIVKAVDRTSAKYGQNLTYTLTVSSPGAADLTDVVVSDPLPVGTSFVSASDSGTCDDPCTRVTWPSVALASDASIERTFVVTIDTPAADAQGGIPAEVITNVGQVETDETGDTPSNEVITDVVTVLGRKIIRKPDDLPFTGAALPLIPAAGMALGVLIAGLALTWAAGPTRRRRNPLA